MTKGIVYLAGPMHGIDCFNFPAFDEAAKRMRADGYVVFSPAENDRENGFDETLNSLDGFDMNKALLWDMEAITQCDIVVVLPGWKNSKGSLTEISFANLLGKPVMEYLQFGFGFRLNALETERTVTDADTGGRKGMKRARYDLIPTGPLHQLAEHYGAGAMKYEDRNWEKGYNWSLSFASLMRHAWAFWNGEDTDTETGSLHIIAAAWHCLALAEYSKTHPEKDDRPKPIQQP